MVTVSNAPQGIFVYLCFLKIIKSKKFLIQNLIMQNDKMVAEYLVQSLKDNLDDLEDKYTQLNREYKHVYRECDLLEHNHERIKKEYQILQQSFKSKRELIEKNGLTISNHLDPTLNEKINFLLHDKINKIQRIKALRSSLDDEKIRSIKLESLSLINGKRLNGDLHKRKNQSKNFFKFKV